MTLSLPFMPLAGAYWERSNKFDVRAARLADRHYPRRKHGARQYMPPGETLVLVLPDGSAAFGWHRPHPDSGIPRLDGLDGWCCSIFRNESDLLSCALIIDAERVLVADGVGCGRDGLFTYVEPARIRSTNPGYGPLERRWQEAAAHQAVGHGWHVGPGEVRVIGWELYCPALGEAANVGAPPQRCRVLACRAPLPDGEHCEEHDTPEVRAMERPHVYVYEGRRIVLDSRPWDEWHEVPAIARREGFPGHDAAWFVGMFCRAMNCRPDALVTQVLALRQLCSCGGGGRVVHEPIVVAPVRLAGTVREPIVATCSRCRGLGFLGPALFVKQDSGPKSGSQGRLSDELWRYKEFPR